MPYQILVQIRAIFLSVSLLALPAASEQGRAGLQEKNPQTQSCATGEGPADEEKSSSPETAAEPQESDPAVDFSENLFKIKSVTGGGFGPAGFLKGAKTESRDHSALIAASERRQRAATQPQPTATQGDNPPTKETCRGVPVPKKTPETAATDEHHEKTEKVEPRSGDGTGSSPPPHKP